MTSSLPPHPSGRSPILARVRVRATLPILLAGLALAACGTVDAGVTATRSRENSQIPATTSPTDDSTPATTEPDTTAPDDPGSPDTTAPDDTTLDTRPADSTIPVPDDQSVIDFGDAKTERDYDGFLVAAFKDIESFWQTNFPELYGSAFQPLKGGIFAAYRARTTEIPGCQSPQTTYDDVEGNAFYCSDGDFIVYDDDLLLPDAGEEPRAERRRRRPGPRVRARHPVPGRRAERADGPQGAAGRLLRRLVGCPRRPWRGEWPDLRRRGDQAGPRSR